MEACVKCETTYRLEKLGVWVIVIRVSSYTFGVIEYVYRADLYQCPKCRHQLLAQFGQPYLENPTEKELELIKQEQYFIIRRLS